MKRDRLRFLTLLFGSLLAMVIVCSHFFVIHKQLKEQVEIAEASTEDSPENEFVFSLPTFSIPTPLQVHLDIDLHFLFEVGSDEDTDQPIGFVEVIHPAKFFVTLFRFIISPNAP